MNRFTNHVIVAAALLLLVAIGLLVNSRKAAAQGPPSGMSVKIVDPLPVPITGSTTVSGTVAATQSGAWNVGISGTPNVNVANSPTVHLSGTPNVNVTNAATAPAAVLDISKSASQNVELACSSTSDQCITSLSNPTPYQVPPGQNLVINAVDIIAGSPPNIFFLNAAPSHGFVLQWVVPNDAVTHSFTYPSGLVFPPGFIFNASSLNLDGPTVVYLQGYLTAN